MAIDRKRFFDGIRSSPFSGRLTSGQVAGISAILDEWERRKLTDLRWPQTLTNLQIKSVLHPTRGA